MYWKLHQLPFMFTPPAAQTTPLLSVCNRSCELWSKGIKWLSETGVTTIVEMSETFQSLSLTMSSPDKADPKYLELAHSVLAVIKKTCQEFCPDLEVLEVISCPPEASSDHSDGTQVELSSLKKAFQDGNRNIADMKHRTNLVMDEWIRIEPRLSDLVGGVSVLQVHGYVHNILFLFCCSICNKAGLQ